MVYIKNYKDFINENYGISNWVKELSEIIYNHILENKEEFKQNKYFTIQLNNYINNSIKIDNSIIRLELSNVNKGLFDDSFYYIKNGVLYNLQINIETININERIKEILNHELTHVVEYYNFNFKNLKNLPKYFTIRKYYINHKDLDNGLNFKNFIYLLYFSLDTELNSRIAELYNVIFKYKNNQYEFIKNILKKHIAFDYLNRLLNFDHIEFVDNTIKEIGLEKFIFISNDMISFIKSGLNGKKFNVISKIDNISDKNDLIKLYKNFEKMFKIKANKHSEKVEKLIRNRKLN